MRIVMVLLTRDQADLVDAVVAFHLDAGVDFVLAVDHESTDGTAEILGRYERIGRLRLIRREGTAIRLLREELARLAAVELGADWVLHPDGDEFWWPWGGSWKALLEALPPRYGVLRGAWRHFAPRPETEAHFAERLVVRVTGSAALTDEAGPFHAGVKTAHRGSPAVELRKGAHDAEIPGLQPLRGAYPFEILHFPLRSSTQARAKYVELMRGLTEGALHVPPHVRRADAELRAGRWQSLYDQLVVDDATLEAGLAAGTLAVDVRLRDRLRLLAGVEELALDSRFSLSRESRSALSRHGRDIAELAALVEELQVLAARESDARFGERVEALDARVGRLEGLASRALVERLKGRLARLRLGGVSSRRGSGGRS